jgi:hypothetical protein
MRHSLKAATIAKSDVGAVHCWQRQLSRLSHAAQQPSNETGTETHHRGGTAAPRWDRLSRLTGRVHSFGLLERQQMATKQQDKHHAEQENQKHEQRSAVIGGQVIRVLGQPDDLRRVDVRQLWDLHYRVNVLVGVNLASARVAHSYFLVTDGDGNVVTSEPTLTRQYPSLVKPQ